MNSLTKTLSLAVAAATVATSAMAADGAAASGAITPSSGHGTFGSHIGATATGGGAARGALDAKVQADRQSTGGMPSNADADPTWPGKTLNDRAATGNTFDATAPAAGAATEVKTDTRAPLKDGLRKPRAATPTAGTVVSASTRLY